MADIYQGMDPREVPTYSFGQVAQYLKLPPSTVRSWVRGQYYETKDGQRHFAPLVETSDPDRRLVSFVNLVELHVLSGIRRHHRVALGKVRRALDYVDEHLGTPHPLARIQFQTDGIDLFIEEYGRLVSASRTGQIVMREVLDAHLKRIERDESGLAARFFPFTRTSGAEQPRVIVIDPRISFGRPVLVGTGVPTEVLLERYLAGDSVEDLAFDYDCDRNGVEEAIRCEILRAA